MPAFSPAIAADVGNHRRLRRGDDIGGVQTAPQPHLQHHDVTARPEEILHSQGGHQLKFSGGVFHPLPRLQHQLAQLSQLLVKDGRSVHLKALMEPPQVG